MYQCAFIVLLSISKLNETRLSFRRRTSNMNINNILFLTIINKLFIINLSLINLITIINVTITIFYNNKISSI